MQVGLVGRLPPPRHYTSECADSTTSAFRSGAAGYNLLLPLWPAMEYVLPAVMKIEHVAFNVTEPVAMAHWYTKHLQMRVVRISGPPWHAHFLADAANQSMIEIYYNSKAPVPPYATMDPLVLHLAFAVDDVPATRARLIQAGATAEGEVDTNPLGDNLAMLRDPWGFAVQLVKRATPMPSPK